MCAESKCNRSFKIPVFVVIDPTLLCPDDLISKRLYIPTTYWQRTELVTFFGGMRSHLALSLIDTMIHT